MKCEIIKIIMIINVKNIHGEAALKSWLHEFFFFLLALTQNSEDLEMSACTCNSKADEARRGPKKLSTNIFALCFLQDLQEAYLRPH